MLSGKLAHIWVIVSAAWWIKDFVFLSFEGAHCFSGALSSEAAGSDGSESIS